jgi:hypothetical protein
MNTFAMRNADSVMKRFKAKIAKDSMSFAGIAVTYPLLSGEKEADAWERWMTTFALRVPGGFKYEVAYKYLADKPKWLLYCDEQKKEGQKPLARPKGVKQAKRVEADKARVARLVKEMIPGDATINNGAATLATNPSAQQPEQGDGSLKAMFKETSESISKISYMLACGQMSPESKAAMKAQAKVDIAAKELDLAMKKLAYKKEMRAFAAQERDKAEASRRLSTTPSSASMPSSVNVQSSDSECNLYD